MENNLEPIGLIPYDIWISQRIKQIKEAIERYNKLNKEIPKEWIIELQQHEEIFNFINKDINELIEELAKDSYINKNKKEVFKYLFKGEFAKGSENGVKIIKNKLCKVKEKLEWFKSCAEYEESVTRGTPEEDYHKGKGTGIQIGLNEINKTLEEKVYCEWWSNRNLYKYENIFSKQRTSYCK